MATTVHEGLKFNDELESGARPIRLALGAVCVSLRDTRSSLDVLRIKKGLELDHGIDTTMTLHHVFPKEETVPSNSEKKMMVALFTPADEMNAENLIRDQAIAELEATRYHGNNITPWSELYHARVFRGPSESVIFPENTPEAPADQVRCIAHLLTAQSAVVVEQAA